MSGGAVDSSDPAGRIPATGGEPVCVYCLSSPLLACLHFTTQTPSSLLLQPYPPGGADGACDWGCGGGASDGVGSDDAGVGSDGGGCVLIGHNKSRNDIIYAVFSLLANYS